MNHVMIDLETFGTRSNSVIVSIGAVAFDPCSAAIGDRFHHAIDVRTATNRGLKIDSSTVLWWVEQSAEARSALVDKVKRASSLEWVLSQFSSFLLRVAGSQYQVKDALVWGNGADFDLALLQQAYEAIGQEKPWKYNASRCYRTMRSEFGIEADYVKPALAHDALEDAIAQAKTLQNIFARLRTHGN